MSFCLVSYSYSLATSFQKKTPQFIDEQLDTGMVQAGLEWFQYTVSTGEIWFFDLLSDGVQAVDQGADWA